MPWERRGSRSYYYRTQRKGDKFVRTYYGGGEEARQAALDHALRRVELLKEAALNKAVIQAAQALIDYTYATQQFELARLGLHLDRDGNPRRMTAKSKANAPDWSAECARRRQHLWEQNREVERLQSACATDPTFPKVASPFPKEQVQNTCVTNEQPHKVATPNPPPSTRPTYDCATEPQSPKVASHFPKDQTQTACVTNEQPHKVAPRTLNPEPRTLKPGVQC